MNQSLYNAIVTFTKDSEVFTSSGVIIAEDEKAARRQIEQTDWFREHVASKRKFERMELARISDSIIDNVFW